MSRNAPRPRSLTWAFAGRWSGLRLNHTGELPVIEGTLIRLEVDHLPGGHDPRPVSTYDLPGLPIA
ncbi:hypothetical protein [Streptomyces sp. NPDC050704]|uniref:hypothetical protein n=1 Tax=Streptomyces sp. NPDC050704 TaxID=3157219 RepID=UPI003449A2EF